MIKCNATCGRNRYGHCVNLPKDTCIIGHCFAKNYNKWDILGRNWTEIWLCEYIRCKHIMKVKATNHYIPYKYYCTKNEITVNEHTGCEDYDAIS